MRITLRGTAGLSKYLRAAGAWDRGGLEVREGETLADLVARLALPSDHDYAVVLNDEMIPEHGRAGRVLQAGDIVAVLAKPKTG